MIVGDIAGIIIPDLPGGMGKAIPGGFPFAVFVPGALNLVRSRRGAPQKILGKCDFACHKFLQSFLIH